MCYVKSIIRMYYVYSMIFCSYFSIAYVLDLLAFVVLHIYLLILRNSIIEIPQDFLIRIPTVDGE